MSPRKGRMAKHLVGGGKGWEREVSAWLGACGGWMHRHEPRMAGKIRVSGGVPDFEIVLNGRAHLVECKHESGPSMDLGRLLGLDRECGSGIKPSQAREMDAATKAGARCWVAASLDLPTTTRRKATQQRLIGTGGDLPAVIRQLVPWALWRARMAAAEEARLRGGDVQASIPAVELVGLGWPIRTAVELRAALLVDNPMDESGGAS